MGYTNESERKWRTIKQYFSGLEGHRHLTTFCFFFFEEILFYIPLQPLTWHHQSKGWNFVIWEMNPRTPWGSLISLCNDGDTKIRDGEKKRDKRV